MKKHISQVPESRKAIAPYNFVELPDKIVTTELDEQSNLRDIDRYYQDRHTGRIECTLTTSSPLYTRCGLTKEEFSRVEKLLREGKDTPDFPEFFYINPRTKKPVIPGSTIRGMIRNLVEIISFSKLSKVSEHQKLFFRAVAADKEDPLKDIYKSLLKKETLKAGYLVKRNDAWYIRPAKKVEDKYFFIYIKEKDIEGKVDNFICMKSLDYTPQYRQNISFEDLYNKNGRRCAKKISSDCKRLDYIGVLVTSGNMLENTNLDNEQQREIKLKSKEGRKYHYLVGIPDEKSKLIKINDDAVKNYRSALTSFQKGKSPYQNSFFDDNNGVLKNGRVIFYSQLQSEEIILFGQSPNFRIPYIPKGKQTAVSAVDFIPEYLRNTSVIDIADAIFGFVRDKKQGEKTQQTSSGRIFVSDAECLNNTDDIWWEKTSNHVITPQILVSPKPTTFQHYLVQPNDTQALKKNLKHYANEPENETVIRGHKLYWHKGSEPQIKHLNPNEAETQTTEIKPVGTGIQFKFTINFENLSDVELGALMWVLDIAANEKYRLPLGMGKPLGMGAVNIEPKLYFSDRTSRYQKLFSENSWETAEESQVYSKYIHKFEEYTLTQLHKDEFYLGVADFKKIPRIKMFLAMLIWEENYNTDFLDKTRYMEIERKQQSPLGNNENEYKARRVLPTPLDINPPVEFEIGQEIDAAVISCKVQQIQKKKKTKLRTTIKYQIEGSDCESEAEVNNAELHLPVGQIEKVIIEKVQGRNVKKVKRIES